WMAIAAAVAAAAILALWLVMRPAAPVPVRAERPEWSAIKRSALTTGEIARPEILRELRPAPSSLRGGRAEAPLTMGRAGVVVESDRPRFYWSPVAGATSYRVLLFSHGQEITRGAPVTAAEWQPAAALVRGGVYEWQVIATTPRGELVLPPPDAPRALF